jgi:hypothetical protein
MQRRERRSEVEGLLADCDEEGTMSLDFEMVFKGESCLTCRERRLSATDLMSSEKSSGTRSCACVSSSCCLKIGGLIAARVSIPGNTSRPRQDSLESAHLVKKTTQAEHVCLGVVTLSGKYLLINHVNANRI